MNNGDEQLGDEQLGDEQRLEPSENLPHVAMHCSCMSHGLYMNSYNDM